MDLFHGAQCAGPDQLDHASGSIFAVPLISHLGRDLVFLRRFSHEAGFGDRVGQGLLAIDVFAQRHRHQRGRSVVMVRGRDGYGVEPFFLLEHLAIVGVAGGFRVAFECSRGPPAVDITEGGDLFTADSGEVRGAFAPGSDDADVELLIGRLSTRKDVEASTEGRAGGQCAALE